MKKKILMVLGTRPEGIKLAPLYKTLRESDLCDVKLCSTGQHKEMLDQVLDFFGIVPDFKFNIMKKNQSLASVTQAILGKLDDVLVEYAPDIVIVQGDTTTVLTAALGAFYRGIKIAHVEAGLRTRNIHNPFPEEANRVLVSQIADYHFAPTHEASDNLLSDHVPKEKIWVSGNTVTDAILLADEIVVNHYSAMRKYFRTVNFNNKVILLTSHRRENLGQGLKSICHAVAEIARNKDVEFVFPVHLNPKVREVVNASLSDIDNVHLIDPLDYPHLVWLMRQSYIVMTDSGGIQEEAPTLGKPVLVMRETTERPEGIEAGTAALVGTDYKKIVDMAQRLLDNTDGLYNKMSRAVNPYGDGNCSQRISDVLLGNI